MSGSRRWLGAFRHLSDIALSLSLVASAAVDAASEIPFPEVRSVLLRTGQVDDALLDDQSGDAELVVATRDGSWDRDHSAAWPAADFVLEDHRLVSLLASHSLLPGGPASARIGSAALARRVHGIRPPPR